VGTRKVGLISTFSIWRKQYLPIPGRVELRWIVGFPECIGVFEEQ
jgi:hypothetical protein